MPITFNTNLAALGAQRNIGIASDAASSSLQKLSSGSRVPQAKDDAAALAIGTKLKSEVAGLTQASNNAGQATSLLQIADGALSTIADILQRMKSLAVQSSSGQLADSDRSLLNQEYTNLQAEVSRVANVSNFNGTSLLKGSTKVASDVNDMVTTADSATTNLIGEGFDSIDFAQDYGAGAIKIDYDKDTKVLTVKDLVNNKTQSVTISGTTIAVGDTESYNFGDIGVKIALNSNFDKATNIAASSTVTVDNMDHDDETAISADAGTLASWGLTGPTVITASVSDLAFDATGADALSPALLDGVALTASGANTAVTFGDVTIGGHTFTTTDTADTSTAGTFTFTFDDGQGNTFDVDLTTTTNSTAGTAAGTVTLGIATPAGAIENSGTGANAPSIISVKESGTAGSEFNFGTVDNSVIALDLTSAAATAATITLNGVSFSTANTGGATADLTTAGVKTLTLADTNGNAFTVQFNVTNAFIDGGTASIDLGQMGQLVGANSVTSGSTTFSFKVGTGTTSDDSISFNLDSATADALGVGSDSIDTAANANQAITDVNAAINTVSGQRASVGAAQSRLGFAANSISVAIENTTAAESSLLDVDVSAEITTFTNENVLMQAGISLLGQANQQPALLLRLLQ